MSAKRTAIFNQGRGKQRGVALMIMLVILVLGVAAIFVHSLSSATLKNARQENTAAALAQAKDALIGYAISYGDTHSGQVHGYLPCPDISGSPEGSAEPVCGSQDVSVIGRLPWATLDLSALRDGDGECLWYAVSGTYKNNPKTGLMNWDTNGQFQAYSSDGTLLTQPDNQVVAVIFAPGAAQSGQDRTGTTAPVCGGNYTATNYLDNDTVHSINNSDVATGKFIQGTSGGSVNDQMLFITRQDIWNAVQKRTDFQNTLQLLTQRVAECIADYGKNNNTLSNKSLPWPAQLSLADYVTNTNYNDNNGLYAGRIPYKVNTARGQTGNSIPSLYYLLQDDNPIGSANCPSGWASIYPWWNNWKDHLFYALSGEFAPQAGSTNPCGTCLKINGSGQYAAVVMFAGQKLPALNQTRVDKSVVTDYLETPNGTNFPGANGNENYKTASASSTFNDVLYCIKEDLSVIQCP